MRLPRLTGKMLRRLGLLGLAASLGTLALDQGERLRAPMAEGFNEAKREMGLVVRHVEIGGRRNAPEAAIGEAVGAVQGARIDALDLAAIKARLEAISWVDRADVARRLPDTLVVQIRERAPFALWQHEGRLVLVDAGGVELTGRYLSRWRDLPLLVGAGAPQAAAELLDVLAQAPTLAERVEAAVRVGERRWDLKMRSGILLRLPAAATTYGLEQAWRRMAALQRRHGLLERDIAIVDLRLPDRLVVRLTPEGRELLAAEEEHST